LPWGWAEQQLASRRGQPANSCREVSRCVMGPLESETSSAATSGGDGRERIVCLACAAVPALSTQGLSRARNARLRRPGRVTWGKRKRARRSCPMQGEGAP